MDRVDGVAREPVGRNRDGEVLHDRRKARWLGEPNR